MGKYDVIVVGGGPAGLTACIYALRGGCSVLLVESAMVGGQCVWSNRIENFPGISNVSGSELGLNMLQQAENLGLKVTYDLVTKIDLENKQITTETSQFQAVCIILAMGSKSRTLGVKNEDEKVGNGIHYCATCDGHFYKDKDVVVVGGGNTAVEDVFYLVNICRSVTLVSKYPELKCQEMYKSEIEKLKKTGKLSTIMSATITKVLGDDKVSGVEISTESGIKEIDTSAVFVAVGHTPNVELVKGQIALSSSGYIASDERMHTSESGVFVAGDIREKPLRQIITACSDGAIAGNEASIYVNNKRR